MPALTDMHLHSNCSVDSKATVAEMCLRSIQLGVRTICFAEHCDFNPLDSGYLNYNHKRCTLEVDSARKKYGNKLEILQGIEFSEPHRYPKEFEAVTSGLDFVLASVHWVGDYLVGDPTFTSAHTVEDVYDLYYAEVLETIKLGGFDSLAHLDQPKRYVGRGFAETSAISTICRELASRGFCLELNSSPLRKGMTEIYPADEILLAYRSAGGIDVTLGSDAHDSCDIASGYDQLSAKVSAFTLNSVIFRKRKRYDAYTVLDRYSKFW